MLRQAPSSNEKKEKGLSDVRRHPPYQRARRQTTSRVEIIKRKNNSLYSRSTKATAAILADRARGPEKIHSWASRIYNHQPGWIRWLFWEPKQETNTIEMILL
ncbi:hypothetical protein N5P37_010502 [Trichoderma harzianum]|nr:hypothetical protein N5P37_010502 [Trichoderma harzianum]